MAFGVLSPRGCRGVVGYLQPDLLFLYRAWCLLRQTNLVAGRIMPLGLVVAVKAHLHVLQTVGHSLVFDDRVDR